MLKLEHSEIGGTRGGAAVDLGRASGEAVVLAEVCILEDCAEPAHCRGMCLRHYRSWYYEQNREKLIAATRARYKASPEANRESARKRYAERGDQYRASRAVMRSARRTEINLEAAGYRERNREAIRVRQAAYRRANPEVYAEWVKANPDYHRLKTQRRRAQEQLAVGIGTITERDWHKAVNRLGGRCYYCGGRPKEPIQMDHVIPLSRGGLHVLGNIVPACRSCNSSKKDKLLIEWRLALKMRAPAKVDQEPRA